LFIAIIQFSLKCDKYFLHRFTSFLSSLIIASEIQSLVQSTAFLIALTNGFCRSIKIGEARKKPQCITRSWEYHAMKEMKTTEDRRQRYRDTTGEVDYVASRAVHFDGRKMTEDPSWNSCWGERRSRLREQSSYRRTISRSLLTFSLARSFSDSMR